MTTTTSTAAELGKFVWYDLMTTAQDKAIPFYHAVAGWGTEPMEGMPYTMWTAGNTPFGGMMEITGDMASQGVTSHWLPYIQTPDTDATAAKAKTLGGKVLSEPRDIPNVGRFGVIADPQGAVFAIFTPSEWTPTPERDAALGEMSWHELLTSDGAKAFEFYSALFGWNKTDAMDMGPEGVYQMYGHNGRTLGGMYGTPNAPPHWLLYIHVDNADAAAERVKKNGGTVQNGPMDVPGGGRIAQCLDPQGAAFAIHSTPPKA